MNKSDMVIGSGGVTLLERMALGKPSISIPVSSNQEQQIELSGLMGATFAVASDLHDINNGLEFILNNYKGREKMSRTARYLVDGNGAKRTASVITDTQINV
jgi:spore coat polysaccharide biosynthesis predicted glycosyltransferase SpsG